MEEVSIVDLHRHNITLAREWWKDGDFTYSGVNVAECIEYDLVSMLNQIVWEQLNAESDHNGRQDQPEAVVEIGGPDSDLSDAAPGVGGLPGQDTDVTTPDAPRPGLDKSDPTIVTGIPVGTGGGVATS